MSIERFNDHIQSAFQALEQRVNGHGNGPMQTMRKKGLASFTEMGVPTTRQEEWKYTNLLPLLGLDFVSTHETEVTASVGAETIDAILEELTAALPADTARLVILNGIYQPSLSRLTDSVAGVSIQVLTDAVVAEQIEIGAALTTAAPLDAHPFVALNTALTDHGIAITVPANITLDAPLHIAVIGDAQTANVLHTPRILVIAEQGSQIDVVESHHTLGSGAALAVSVTEIVARQASTVKYVKINADAGSGTHIGYTGGHVYRDAVIRSSAFCIDGPFTRNDLELRLMEPNASAYLDGVSVLSGTQYADNHTVVDHMVPHCHSEELYKGVYDGSSTGVFNGKIFVRPQAQKTTAYQSNHSLLLSDRASVNAKPQLEIFADDVKCSHGATMGQLDEEAVFYLRARGVGHDEARALMTYAFAAEVIERLHLDGLRTHLEEVIANKIGTLS